VPDLLILDVAMPGVDGLGVARRLRTKRLSLPILFLTARDSVADRVDGFDAGADDYLVKPFAMEELLVRVRALLRRGRLIDKSLVYRDLRLDPVARFAFRGGREIRLTERETALLDLLIRNAGLVVSRAQAVNEVWDDSTVGFNVVDRYVAYLRRKLGRPPLIETVRGVVCRGEGESSCPGRSRCLYRDRSGRGRAGSRRQLPRRASTARQPGPESSRSCC
jgi:DNA-binding response OmpR family regulator